MRLLNVVVPKDLPNGVAGIDANLNINTTQRLQNKIGGFGKYYTSVQGNWNQYNNASQTDFDPILVALTGYIGNNLTPTNLDEIKWPNITLLPGTYLVRLATITEADYGILEILFGSTSLFTFDAYTASTIYNVTKTFTFTVSVTTTADFRFRVNGKNASSSGYNVIVSRLEILKIDNLEQYTDSRYKIISSTHDISVTGDQAFTGAGFAPKGAAILAAINNSASSSLGFTDGTASVSQFSNANFTLGDFGQNTTLLIEIATTATNFATAVLKTMDSDGMTITWAKTGTPTGTAILLIMFFR